MMDVLIVSILQPLEIEKIEWARLGVKVAEEWEEMHPFTFAAWCRRDGVHKTNTQGFKDWNDDLAEILRESVAKVWPGFTQGLQSCKEDFLEKLVLLVEGIRLDLKGIPGIVLLPMTPFKQSLSPKKEDLLRHLDLAFEKIERISDIARNTATSTEEDSVVMEGMMPLYEKMLSVSGSALFVQRKTLLNDSMKRGEPFATTCPRIKKIFEDAFHKQQTDLEAGLGKVFDSILQDFDRQFVVVEEPDERRDAMKKRVLDFVEDADAKLAGPIEIEFAKAMLA